MTLKIHDMADNQYAVGSIDHLGMLLDLAICRSEEMGIPFRREEYKWVLGAKVICDIEKSYEYISSLSPAGPRTLFGVIVEPDYANPNNIQLWENITNKV